MPYTAEWRALPQKLEELILSKLPLVDLARLSSTSKTFEAVFCMQLGQEQKVRCDFAAKRFGRDRIVSIAALINRLLKGESLDPFFAGIPENRMCRMSQDGTCVRKEPAVRLPDSQGK
jgi:hypothetical protein